MYVYINNFSIRIAPKPLLDLWCFTMDRGGGP